MAAPPTSSLMKKTLSGNGVISSLQELRKDNWLTTKVYIYIASIYLTRTGLFNQVASPLTNQEPFSLHQLVKKKVATTISTRYYSRNFLLKTLHQRSLSHYKEARLLNYYRKEVRLLSYCRRQIRSLGPRSRGVTLSRGVPLAIIISHRSSIGLLLLTINRQVLTNKSFLI